jgi:cytochrome d ubiquinol oxidase subunit I
MDDLLAARLQMAVSLGFHMIFATIGIGMPLLMVIAEAAWLRTREPVWLELARRWGKGTAIVFVVGAVSGTVLSFELGLLWPTFMEHAGPIIGMPFSLEGFAFFFEAIFLGVYLYGWQRVPPIAHWLAGVGVWLSGTLSGIFVVTANAWMNTPAGFTLAAAGSVATVDPFAAMMNPSAFGQVLHMTTAAFLATGWLVAGIHAWLLLSDRDNAFHRKALALSLAVAMTFTVLQPITGHRVGHAVAENQPVKLAALEGLWETQRRAPFTLLGWPDEEAEVTRYAIEIPGLLSWVAYGDVDAEVMGLEDVPLDERPPVAVVHVAYQIMLATAAVMGITSLAAVALSLVRRQAPPLDPWFLRLVVATGPLGIVGIEAGWTATEVGRQPWIVYGWMRTADAVTTVPNLWITFVSVVVVYLGLGILCLALLRRQFLQSPSFPERDNRDAGPA